MWNNGQDLNELNKAKTHVFYSTNDVHQINDGSSRSLGKLLNNKNFKFVKRVKFSNNETLFVFKCFLCEISKHTIYFMSQAFINIYSQITLISQVSFYQKHLEKNHKCHIIKKIKPISRKITILSHFNWQMKCNWNTTAKKL